MRIDLKGSIILSLLTSAFISLLFISPIWTIVLGIALYLLYKNYFKKQPVKQKRYKYNKVDCINELWYH